MAIKAKAKASSSTYLDIGLSHIGGLNELARLKSTIEDIRAYQSAHNDLARCSRSRSRMNCLGGGLGCLGRLLHTSDRGLSRGTAVRATAVGLTAGANKVIQRAIKVGRHDEDWWDEMTETGDLRLQADTSRKKRVSGQMRHRNMEEL